MNDNLNKFLDCLNEEQLIAFRNFALTMPRITDKTVKIVERTLENRESLERRMLWIAGKGN